MCRGGWRSRSSPWEPAPRCSRRLQYRQKVAVGKVQGHSWLKRRIDRWEIQHMFRALWLNWAIVVQCIASQVPSGAKYCRSNWSCAPAERDKMLIAAASVIAPPNPLIFWYFLLATIVNRRPGKERKKNWILKWRRLCSFKTQVFFKMTWMTDEGQQQVLRSRSRLYPTRRHTPVAELLTCTWPQDASNLCPSLLVR